MQVPMEAELSHKDHTELFFVCIGEHILFIFFCALAARSLECPVPRRSKIGDTPKIYSKIGSIFFVFLEYLVTISDWVGRPLEYLFNIFERFKKDQEK